MLNFIKKYFITLIFISIGIYFFDQGMSWLGGNNVFSFSKELKKFSIFVLYSTVIGYGNISVVDFLNQKYPWHDDPQKRAIYGIVGSLFISMFLILCLRIFTVLGLYARTWEYFITHESAYTYVYSLIISLVIVLGFYSYYFFKELSKKSIQQHQTVAKTETAKYESLKSQLDPHFLFNSLNVLTSLIGENPKQAEQFTTKLSQVYRYVVAQKNKDLVSLKDELVFAKTYMELLKVRFENAVIYELPNMDACQGFKIVPLSLQLLLENAVKHNVISDESPLKIEIKIEGNELLVSNNFAEKRSLTKGTGIGLNNIRERYALLSDRKPSINRTPTHFIVKLPLLTQKSNIMNTQNLNEENRYIKAKKSVEKIKEFYSNLLAYLLVIPFLIVINYLTSWEFKWFFFPMFGWGIGLAFHYMGAFGYDWFLGKNWEERKIKDLMHEEQKDKWL